MSTRPSQPHSTHSTSADSLATLNIVERNVRALVEHAAEQERTKSAGDRVASTVSSFIGSMKFVYIHLIALLVWGVVRLGLVPGVPPLGVSFTRIGTIASLEAILIATFVLIEQNRMSRRAEIRNHLDVQVSLLNEHETTHILRLAAAMAEKMELPEAQDPEIKELIRDVEPRQMIDRIEVHSGEAEERIRGDKKGK